MSASISSNEQTVTPPLAPGKRNGRPQSAEQKMKSKAVSSSKSPKAGKSGLMNIFKNKKTKENGVVPVRPSCFNDDFVRRPEVPDSPSRGPAASKSLVKEERGYGLWRSKGKCEWESDSGRMLTLRAVDMSRLSQVELLAFQRVAINQLQSMNLPVSHALINASKKGRLSFNSFNKRRISAGTDQAIGIFGQPIDKIATDQPQSRPNSGSMASTPLSAGSTRGTSLQPPSSPTSNDTFLMDSEPNPTAVLLEALSKTDKATAPPSPKTQRQLALKPSEPRVPPIVRKTIEFLEQRAVNTEGLFRISGSKARIHEIRRRFDKGQDVDLSDANPHDVAALLKEFFRSLPEPLMTRDLFGPILSTRKLSSSAGRRDALRLFCLLLPQANRDTLQELLQFLSRVALHSDGIILIDGTEETGNRMTEQNLGLIMGPNILHKERRSGSGKPDYQVVKQDQDELVAVCKVMEDLIRMHASVFAIPAELYDQAIKILQTTDPEAVDTLLKRKWMDQDSDGSRHGGVTPGSTPNSTLRLVVQSSPSWRRSRSLSDTEKTLDDAIKELDSLQVNITDDLETARHRHYSSNDSAMGGSELIMSPAPSAGSEPSTLTRARNITRNRSDSAFSNNTSPTNSSNEGMSGNDILSMESGPDNPAFIHQRNASTLSSTSEPDRQLIEGVGGGGGEGGSGPVSLPRSSPSVRPRNTASSDTVSLPTFSPERELEQDVSLRPEERSVSDIASAKSMSLKHHQKMAGSSGSVNERERAKHNKKWKLRTMPSVTSTGTYSPSRSPVLKSRGFEFSSEALHENSTDSSANPTPTPPTTTSSYLLMDPLVTTNSIGSASSSYLSDEGTVI